MRVLRSVEAHKKSVILAAEAQKHHQIAEITSAMNRNVNQATMVMLEFARIEQLKSIAGGSNNTVYFAKDKNMAEGYTQHYMQKVSSSQN